MIRRRRHRDQDFIHFEFACQRGYIGVRAEHGKIFYPNALFIDIIVYKSDRKKIEYRAAFNFLQYGHTCVAGTHDKHPLGLAL